MQIGLLYTPELISKDFQILSNRENRLGSGVKHSDSILNFSLQNDL